MTGPEEQNSNAGAPSAARWERWERDKLIELAESLGRPFGASHNNEKDWSVYRVYENRSVHLRFEEASHCAYVTRIYNDLPTQKEWLTGGIRAWLDELDIDRDKLIEYLMDQ